MPASTPLAGSTTSGTVVPPTSTTVGLDTAEGLLLVGQRVSFAEQTTLFMRPDGTVVGQSDWATGNFQWAEAAGHVLGYGSTATDSGLVWIDPAIPTITPVPELAGQSDLFFGTIDQTTSQSGQSRYSIVSDDENESYLIDLETTTVSELSDVILRSVVYPLGASHLLGYGPERDLRLIEVATGSVETLPNAGFDPTVAPGGGSFIYRDPDIRAFRERTVEGEDRLITSSEPVRAFYRPNGDIVLVTPERIVARTGDGDEVLYTAQPTMAPVIISPFGVVALEDSEGNAVWVPTDGSQPVRLDHPGWEARDLAVIDDLWLLVEENDGGLVSLIDLQSGESSQLGEEASARTLIGNMGVVGQWFQVPLRSDGESEVWLIHRETGQLVVVPAVFRLILSPDARWLAYGRDEESGRVVYVAPIDDPLAATSIAEGSPLLWMPAPASP